MNSIITLLLGAILMMVPTPKNTYDVVEQYKYENAQYWLEVKAEREVEYASKSIEQAQIPETPTTTAGDLGILNIPNAGIYVGLYSDANAFQSSGKASVQYYNQYGIKWIADHCNQDGFWNLKNLSVGSTVYVNDTAYTVVDNVYAADYYSNFNAWVGYIGDSTLVLQTCEGDGARLVRCQ